MLIMLTECMLSRYWPSLFERFRWSFMRVNANFLQVTGALTTLTAGHNSRLLSGSFYLITEDWFHSALPLRGD